MKFGAELIGSLNNERYILYKAVKHQVDRWYGEHGFDLNTMWNIVNGKTEYDADFWKRICLSDYRADSKPTGRKEEE